MELKDLDNMLDEAWRDSNLQKSLLDIENASQKVGEIKLLLNKLRGETPQAQSDESNKTYMSKKTLSEAFFKTKNSEFNDLSKIKTDLDKAISEYYQLYNKLFMLLNTYPALQVEYGSADMRENKKFPSKFYIMTNQQRDAGGMKRKDIQFQPDNDAGMDKIIENLTTFKKNLDLAFRGKSINTNATVKTSPEKSAKIHAKFLKLASDDQKDAIEQYKGSELKFIFNSLFGKKQKKSRTVEESIDMMIESDEPSGVYEPYINTTKEACMKAVIRFLVATQKNKDQVINLAKSPEDFKANFSDWYKNDKSASSQEKRKINPILGTDPSLDNNQNTTNSNTSSRESYATTLQRIASEFEKITGLEIYAKSLKKAASAATDRIPGSQSEPDYNTDSYDEKTGI